jgi:UDP:flavonoid glycosyltransferase YjiC (YdhE family)
MAPSNVFGWPVYEALVGSRICNTLNDCRSHFGLSRITQWASWLQYKSKIGFWPSWFADSGADSLSGINPVGFVLGDDYSDEAPNLEAKELLGHLPIVLISAGTGFFVEPEFFRLAVEGCEIAGCKPIIVCRHRSLIPEDVLKHYRVVRYVNWESILPHTAVCFNHGGMGIVGQAIKFGVPQVIVAKGGDRPDNAERVQKLGIGYSVKSSQRNAQDVAAIVSRLASSKAVRARCDEVSRLITAAPNPLSLVCAAVEQVLKDAEHSRISSAAKY